jgi:Tfp pilus assembly protein PilN
VTQGESRIFLTTFPRNLADALVRMLHQAGVRPYILDLAPLALCRIPNEPRAIIVNARLDHLDVIVLADRLPQVIRRLSMPGEIESLDEKMPLIAEEFHRTVAFYNSSHIEKPLDSTVPVFVSGDLAEAQETWQSMVGQSGYSVSPLPVPVEPPEGFNANEFMVNIGLAFKELLSEKEEANFSLVNFNALPETYVPPRFSIARVLVPVGIAVAAGLIIFGVIFIQSNRAENRTLNSQLTAAEASVAQLQKEILGLKTQASSAEAIAGELDARITTLERERATIHEDLTQIVTLAQNNVTLGNVNHGGRSVSVQGVASSEDAIFDYARDLRSGGRFSRVWISSITQGQGGFNFSFSLTK